MTIFNLNKGLSGTGTDISSWNINTTILASRTETNSFVFDFNNQIIRLSEIYNGVKRGLHEFYINSSSRFPHHMNMNLI